MAFKKFVVVLLFLLMPIASLFLIELYDLVDLTNWTYANLVLSTLFALAFSFGKNVMAKIISVTLFLSLIAMDAYESFGTKGLEVGDILLAIISMVFKISLGLLVYYWLFRPSYESEAV